MNEKKITLEIQRISRLESRANGTNGANAFTLFFVANLYRLSFLIILFFILKNFIEVSLIYNVVLGLGVQQSDSVLYAYICMYIYILFSDSFLLYIIIRYGVEFPVLYHRSFSPI